MSINTSDILLKRPIRRCAACHNRLSASELLHFVKMSDGYVVNLESGAGCGRGLYLCPAPQCLKKFQGKILDDTVQALAEAIDLREQQLVRSGNMDSNSPARKELQKNTKLLATLRNGLTNKH